MQAQWDAAQDGGGSKTNRRGSTKGYELSEMMHSSGAEAKVQQLLVRARCPPIDPAVVATALHSTS